MNTSIQGNLFAYYQQELVEVVAMFDLLGVDCCEVRYPSESNEVRFIVPANRLRATFTQISDAAKEMKAKEGMLSSE